MTGSRSRIARISGVLVLVISLLSVGAWIAYRSVRQQRMEVAVVAAADFYKAARDGDELAFGALLPPEFASQMRDSDYEAIWPFFAGCEHDDRDSGDTLTDTYTFTDGSGEQTGEFELRSGSSLSSARVEASWDWTFNDTEGHAKETLDLQWLDGAWRISKYECSDLDTDIVFFDDESDPKDLVEACVETLGGTLRAEQLATSLPEGHVGIASPGASSPEGVVRAYFDALIAEDYPAAFALLPLNKQENYGDVAPFQAQVEGYDVQSYTIDSVTVDQAGGTAVVLSTAQMAGGAFQYEWRLQETNDRWAAIDRVLPGLQ